MRLPCAGRTLFSGMLIAHQAFGDMFRWNPHFHAIVLKGGFDNGGHSLGESLKKFFLDISSHYPYKRLFIEESSLPLSAAIGARMKRMFYPFVEPSVKPFTRDFCVNQPKMTGGKTTMREAAESCARNIPCCSRKRGPCRQGGLPLCFR